MRYFTTTRFVAAALLATVCLALIPADALSAKRSAAKRTSAKVKQTNNIPYADTKNARQTLDVMVPKTPAAKALPVIVYVHGGAWKTGSKSAGRARLQPLVASGNYAGVSVGYRLSGEAAWPAQIYDCNAAIRWVRANAVKHGFDPDRIAVWGSSAGGHLAAMLGTSGGHKMVEGKLGPNTKVSSKVQCVVDFFGPTDLLKLAGPTGNMPQSPLYQLFGGPFNKNLAKVRTANPINYVSKSDPPFLIVHGTNDPLVPISQSKLLDAALARVKVSSTLVTVNGGGHGKGFGKDVTETVTRFFDHHLRKTPTKWADHTIKAQ